jgi:hypothetical protein
MTSMENDMEASRVGQLAGLDHTFSGITQNCTDEKSLKSDWGQNTNNEEEIKLMKGEGVAWVEIDLDKLIKDNEEKLKKLKQDNPNISEGLKEKIGDFPTFCRQLLKDVSNGAQNDTDADKKIREEFRMIVKQERFERLVPKRVQKAEDALRMVRNMANTSNYEYSETQAKQIIDHLRQELNLLKTSFQGGTNKKRGFRLK